MALPQSRAFRAFGLVALSAACQATPQPSAHAAAPGERIAELYLTTEVGGSIEPCGCTSKPLGGLGRLATVLSRGRPARILIDAGELFFPPAGLEDVAREQHERKAKLLARAYRALGAAAINLGPGDLAAGSGFLKALQRDGAVPLVSSNIRPVGDGGPAIAQSFVREVGGIAIGITGAATPERFTDTTGFAALELLPALRAETAALRQRGADLVVVLLHGSAEEAVEVARELPQADVIVRAPGTPIGQPPQAPRQVGSAVIVEAGSQGQHVGRLTVYLGREAPRRPLGLDDGGEAERQARALTERKRRALQADIDRLRASGATDEALAPRVAQLDRLDERLAPPAGATPTPGTGDRLRFELVPLSDDVPEAASLAELMKVYYADLHRLNADKGDPRRCALPAGISQPTYVGNGACRGCHAPAFAVWEKTKHAQAWETLERRGKHFDLTCVGCHVVGYEQPGGVCKLTDLELYKDVGCESCHGPGSTHSQTSGKGAIDKADAASTCTARCHVPEHSDRFDDATYRPRILGPGHGQKPQP